MPPADTNDSHKRHLMEANVCNKNCIGILSHSKCRTLVSCCRVWGCNCLWQIISIHFVQCCFIWITSSNLDDCDWNRLLFLCKNRCVKRAIYGCVLWDCNTALGCCKIEWVCGGRTWLEYLLPSKSIEFEPSQFYFHIIPFSISLHYHRQLF